MAIKENGEHTTMGQLAEETGQVSATMTGIIDRLVERGWVERYGSSHDRRTVLVRLTEAGLAKLNDVYHARRAVLATNLGKLDPNERRNLALSLKEYLETIDLVS
jgi:DNA-binding MarR family transcriptional regulator